MDPTIGAALIAGSISTVVGALTLSASWVQVRAAFRRQDREHRERYAQAIFDKRVAAYANAFRITGRLSSTVLRGAADGVVNAQGIFGQIVEERKQLQDWYDKEGALVLSEVSRERFFELRKWCLGTKEPTDVNDQLLNYIWCRKMDFRHSLRYDIFLERRLKTHKPEEWPLA